MEVLFLFFFLVRRVRERAISTGEVDKGHPTYEGRARGEKSYFYGGGLEVFKSSSPLDTGPHASLERLGKDIEQQAIVDRRAEAG